MPFYFILFPSCIVFLCPMYFVIMSNKQFWSWSWSTISGYLGRVHLEWPLILFSKGILPMMQLPHNLFLPSCPCTGASSRVSLYKMLNIYTLFLRNTSGVLFVMQKRGMFLWNKDHAPYSTKAWDMFIDNSIFIFIHETELIEKKFIYI